MTLIPSPMAAAMIVKKYLETMYEIELEDTDIFFIRGLFHERDVDMRDRVNAAIDVIKNMTVKDSNATLFVNVDPKVLEFSNELLDEFKQKALRALLQDMSIS